MFRGGEHADDAARFPVQTMISNQRGVRVFAGVNAMMKH
jgi:hypothetical protein